MRLSDQKYLEWCKQQTWLDKYPIVYNICVNQTITNHNSKTPEHNKMQNMFVKESVQKNLLDRFTGSRLQQFKEIESLLSNEELPNYCNSVTMLRKSEPPIQLEYRDCA